MTSATPLISPATLTERVRAASRGDGEIAVIDVREQYAYAERLILLSSNLPLTRLELHVATALPRLHTPLVIVDDHGELAEHAAQRLHALGYTDVSVLAGGLQAWEAAGLPVYDGFNVRSKAFAEQIEHDFATPAISATELFARQARGEDILVLDSRPYDEYHHSTVPGALSVPGAELVRTVRDIAPAASTTLVVSCGGRTRSIVGAQSLISAGVPNPVLSLRNGTGGLRLDGIALQYGATRAHARPSDDALAWAEDAAHQRFVDTQTLRLSPEQLQRWQADAQRTLYVLDLREAEAFAAGHLAAARNVSGGQVLQAIDVHAPVWNARIALIDDGHLVRARQTAFWLGQLGSFEVGIIADDAVVGARAEGVAVPPVRQALRAAVARVEARALAQGLGQVGTAAIDAPSEGLVRQQAVLPQSDAGSGVSAGGLFRQQAVLPQGGDAGYGVHRSAAGVKDGGDGEIHPVGAQLAGEEAGPAGPEPVVIDLSLSPAYRKAHIPGSRWALRSQLPDFLRTLPPEHPVVLTCEDGRLSRIAAEALAAEDPALAPRLRTLTGGNHAWQHAGLPTQAATINGPADVAHFIDVWTPPQQTIGDLLGAVKKYLNWEVDLLDQLARDPLKDVVIRGLRVPGGV